MALSHDQVRDQITKAFRAGATAQDERTLFVSMQTHLDVNPYVLPLPAEVVVSGVGIYYILKEPNLNLFLLEQEVRNSA